MRVKTHNMFLEVSNQNMERWICWHCVMMRMIVSVFFGYVVIVLMRGCREVGNTTPES